MIYICAFMLNRNLQPKITDATAFNIQLKPYRYFELDNGIPVYAIDSPEQEVTLVEWVFYAGSAYDEKNLTASAVNFLLKNGTKNKSAFEINEFFEFYGAYLSRSCYTETATIKLHCLSKYLLQLLPVVRELLTESIFPEDELALYKQNQKQHLEVYLKKCDFVANRMIDRYLFGMSHPYGKYSSTLDFDNLERGLLLQFYKDYYVNGKCILFISGNLPGNIDTLLNQNFGTLLCNKKMTGAISYNKTPDPEKIHSIINDANSVQGAIRIARDFPNRHHPDFPKAMFLNNILGGYFGSRLMSNIRENKGYTYGIHSYLQNNIHESAWVITTEAGRDVCEATISETFKEMERLRNEQVSEDELHLVRNYMMGSLLGLIDGPFQIISRWKNYILNGLDENYFNNYVLTIKNIQAEELQQLANKYLQPEAFYQLTVI